MMRLPQIASLLAFAPLLVCTAGHADSGPQPSGRWSRTNVGDAATPPMGWNSWNAFGTGLDEAKVIGAAQAIIDHGLAQQGYRYINLDDGWWRKRRMPDGRMQVRTNLFPSAATGGSDETSFRPFTDKLHAMGLKAGIYTDIGRNACSQAWSPDNPNLPEGTRDEREVGLYDHVKQDLALYFGVWNFDYIKVDACGLSALGADRPLVQNGTYRVFPPLVVDANVNQTNIPAVKTLYSTVRDALSVARPRGDFVLSLCNWGSANVRAWGKDVGTMWRTSNDIDPSWGRMLHNFDSVATRELYAGPGHWNDPDMLEVGNGAFDNAHLTEARSHMSLWAIEAAPLLIGTDLRNAPPAIFDIFGAPEVIAVDQDSAGHQGVLAYTDNEQQIIVKTLSVRGEKAVALFNRTNDPVKMTLTAAHLKMRADQPIMLRDLWARADIGSMTGLRGFQLKPHETIFLKARGTPLLATGAYLSEIPGRINVAEDGITALEADPIIHREIDPYHASTTSDGNRPSYAGWGAPRADATPYDESLRVANVQYRYGIGALANSRLEVKADGAFTTFTAMVGVDDSSRGKSVAVRFEVYGDGKRLAKSAPMRFNQPATALRANVTGVSIIELIARQKGHDQGNVIVTWGDARVE